MDEDNQKRIFKTNKKNPSDATIDRITPGQSSDLLNVDNTFKSQRHQLRDSLVFCTAGHNLKSLRYTETCNYCTLSCQVTQKYLL